MMLVASGCTTTRPLPVESYPSSPATRTHWELSHRVVDAPGLRVTDQRIGHWDESTSVAVSGANGGATDDCYVAVAVPGHGGPDNMVGEKVTTTFHGQPAVRNGVGAEGDYLMWRLDRPALEQHCWRGDQRRLFPAGAFSATLTSGSANPSGGVRA